MVLAFTTALMVSMIYAIVSVALGVLLKKRKKTNERLPKFNTIVMTIVIFSVTVLFLYFFSRPQTCLEIYRWLWIILLVNLFILVKENYEGYDLVLTLIMALVSFSTFIVCCFGPVQNLIYVNEISDGDITYAIVSDEILANINIDNSRLNKYKYDVDEPEIRMINNQTVAVYHIIDKNAGNNDSNLEYIPGYIIQEKGKAPEIVTSRIYFDPSFVLGRDALRVVRRKYPTVIINDYKFDIDDDWKPYIIFQYRENMFFNTEKEYGLITLNMLDGTCQKYPASENTPEWVDFKTVYVQ